VRGIPHLNQEQNKRYRKFRNIFLRSSKIKEKEVNFMNQKCQVQKISVSAMDDVLKGRIDVAESNSAARHGSNFVRLAEHNLKIKQFNSREKRRKNAIKKLNKM
jgi:hypothetical protein